MSEQNENAALIAALMDEEIDANIVRNLAAEALTRTRQELEEAKRERDEARQCDAITALRSLGPAEEEV